LLPPAGSGVTITWLTPRTLPGTSTVPAPLAVTLNRALVGAGGRERRPSQTSYTLPAGGAGMRCTTSSARWPVTRRTALVPLQEVLARITRVGWPAPPSEVAMTATITANPVATVARTGRGNAASHGKRLRFLYATQPSVAPPLFVFFVNDPDLVHFSYQRYLENLIRERWKFTGTPIRMAFRQREKER